MQVQQVIRFGSLAQIAGYDFTQDAGAKTLRVRLYWQVLSETQTSYKVFVHVVTPGGQSPAAQHDSVPANGDLPTTAWVHGEYITDEHVIALPDLPAGPYRVLAGLYDPQSGVRLPAFAADGHEFANDAGELLEFQLGR